MYIFTGNTIATTSFLSGYLDISWYIPGSGTGHATVTGIVGCFDGTNIDQQTIHGTYTNTVAAMNQVVGVSLFLTASGSPLFSSACSADVIMNRLQRNSLLNLIAFVSIYCSSKKRKEPNTIQIRKKKDIFDL